MTSTNLEILEGETAGIGGGASVTQINDLNIGAKAIQLLGNGERNGNPLQDSCWEIPWTEEPGRLQLMRSQRVRQDLATK